jgi:hypothetical protein
MKRTASAGKKSNGSGTSTRPLRSRRTSAPKYAVCVDNSGYPASLELHKIYRVLRDDDAFEQGDLRIIDESGEDYLYSSKRFVPIELPKKLKASLNAS